MNAQPSALWHRHPSLAYLAVFVGVCGHASSEFVAKLISINSGIAGPEISVWRFALGGLGLIIVALLIPSSRNLVTPLKRNGPALLGFSVLGVATAYLFFHWSLDYATVPQVATVITAVPIFIGIVNRVANKVALTAPKIVTGAAAVLGVAFLVTDGALLAQSGEPSNLIGIALAILCALFMSVYLVLIKPYIEEYGALRITAITLFIGGLTLWLGVGLLFGKWVNFAVLTSLVPIAAIAIIVLALYNTTITQWLWIGGLAAAPDMTRAMYLFFLKPVMAAFLSVAFLGTNLSVWQVLAILVICSAVAVEASWDRLFSRKAAAVDDEEQRRKI